MNIEDLRARVDVLVRVVFIGLIVILAVTILPVVLHLLTDMTIDEVAISVGALGVSLISLLVTIVLNIMTYRRTRDVYQPGVQVEWVAIPLVNEGTVDEVVIAICNNGRRNLPLEHVTLRGSWFKETLDCKLDSPFVAPGERSEFSVKVPYPPLDERHELILQISDSKSKSSWTRRNRFSVPGVPFAVMPSVDLSRPETRPTPTKSSTDERET